MGQSSLESYNSALRGSCNFPLIIEGVVTAVHYPDEGDNHRDGFQVLYDVDPVSTPGLPALLFVPYMRDAAGFADGDEIILRAASKSISGGAFDKENNNAGKHNDLLNTDGDRVVVGFLNGSFHSPVILGVLPNAKSKLDPMKDSYGNDLPKDKLVRRSSHRGTEFLADADGNVSINFAGHPEDSSVGNKKQLKLHIGDIDVVFDNQTSPSSMAVTKEGGGSIILKLDEQHLEAHVSGPVELDAGGEVNVKSSGGNVNVTAAPGTGQINLGGASAVFAVAMDMDTAGPYPIKAQSKVVKGAKG